MATPSADDPVREERLNEIIAGTCKPSKSARRPTRTTCARHPDLATELAAFLADRVQFAQFAGSPLHAPSAVHPAEAETLAPIPAANAASAETIAPSGIAVFPAGTIIRYFGDYELL